MSDCRSIRALAVYDEARIYVDRHPSLRQEVLWQRSRSIDALTESDFLRESAWVVLCSGFKESIVNKWFSYISLCFCDWESASQIIDSERECIESAHKAIRHRQKLSSIVEIARRIHEQGFPTFKASLFPDPVESLQSLPFIGPITSQHLAKNIGVPIAKSDRHLWRLAKVLGFHDADELCSDIGNGCGEATAVVDVILWRYIADNGFKNISKAVAEPPKH